jgi:hypothetical protein
MHTQKAESVGLSMCVCERERKREREIIKGGMEKKILGERSDGGKVRGQQCKRER